MFLFVFFCCFFSLCVMEFVLIEANVKIVLEKSYCSLIVLQLKAPFPVPPWQKFPKRQSDWVGNGETMMSTNSSTNETFTAVKYLSRINLTTLLKDEASEGRFCVENEEANFDSMALTTIKATLSSHRISFEFERKCDTVRSNVSIGLANDASPCKLHGRNERYDNRWINTIGAISARNSVNMKRKKTHN